MFCPTCGNQLNDNAKFCSACGSAVPSAGTAPTPQAQASTDQAAAATTVSSFGGAAAANAPQQNANTAQPDANAAFASTGAQASAVSASKAAPATSKFKNPFFIGALAASVLLVLTLFMTWIEMTCNGSTTSNSGLSLTSEYGGVYPRLIALLGLVSIGTLNFLHSPKKRSILGIIAGSLSLVCAAYETNLINGYIETFNSQAADVSQAMNSTFLGDVVGTSASGMTVSLGIGGGLAIIASVALIALNVKMFLDAKKAADIAA